MIFRLRQPATVRPV